MRPALAGLFFVKRKFQAPCEPGPLERKPARCWLRGVQLDLRRGRLVYFPRARQRCATQVRTFYLVARSATARAAVMAMCSQAGAAARTIAAKSQRVGDVQHVVGNLIAERRFPALADKDVAMADEFVILTRARLSPKDIAAKFEQDCQARVLK